MGRRRSLQVVGMVLLLLIACAAAARGPVKQVGARRWSRLKVSVIGGSAKVTLSDPRGRTAALNDSSSRSGIPGCTVTLNRPSESSDETVYLGGGSFDVTNPTPGDWALAVQMERDRPRTNLNTIGVYAMVFRGEAMATEKRDGARLIQAGESACWKVAVRSPGLGADSVAVRLARVAVKSQGNKHGL